jgi:hypothetical protein
MAHKWIARKYIFEKGTDAEVIKRVGDTLMRLGYGMMPIPETSRDVPRGVKVGIAEPEDRLSRKSALESLNRVFKMVAENEGLRYSIGKVVRIN